MTYSSTSSPCGIDESTAKGQKSRNFFRHFNSSRCLSCKSKWFEAEEEGFKPSIPHVEEGPELLRAPPTPALDCSLRLPQWWAQSNKEERWRSTPTGVRWICLLSRTW